MNTNEHTFRLQSTHTVELVAHNYLLAVYVQSFNVKCDYRYKETYIFNKMCCVVEVLVHWSILAKRALTLNYPLLKNHTYMITLNNGVQ